MAVPRAPGINRGASKPLSLGNDAIAVGESPRVLKIGGKEPVFAFVEIELGSRRGGGLRYLDLREDIHLARV